jgi:predicted lipoprotein
VAIGPVLERRAQRQIDFMPTRPRMIEKAVKSSPATPADMERIGTPAKGFPALEWLLWVKPARPASPECRYAVQVAAEIGREAEALATARPAPGDGQEILNDLVNQWIGGLERLRWAHMELPLRQTMTSEHAGGTAPDFPRKASAASASSWAHQWQALKALATGPASLRSALVARGQAADGLVQAVERADLAMAGLSASDEQRILAATQALADLQRQVEARVAPALGVSIGFSDADGD